MANLNAPAGFRVVGLNGVGAYTGAWMRVAFAAGDSVAAFKGSMVKWTGATDTDGYTPVVAVAAAGDAKLAGAVQSFAPQVNRNWTTYYKPASTRMYAYIPADKFATYQCQEDSVGGNMALTTSIGKNVNYTTESGDTVSGNSTMQLDSSTVADTNTLNIRIISPVNRADNSTSSSDSNAVWNVMLNLDSYTNTTGV